jgi:hypothetical protein
MTWQRKTPTPEEQSEIMNRLLDNVSFPLAVTEWTTLFLRELPPHQTVSVATVRRLLGERCSWRHLRQGEGLGTGPDPRVYHRAEYFDEDRDVEAIRHLLDEADRDIDHAHARADAHAHADDGPEDGYVNGLEKACLALPHDERRKLIYALVASL